MADVVICTCCRKKKSEANQITCLQHKTCSQCVLRVDTGDVTCPCCVVENSNKFISQNKICSVCHVQISKTDRGKSCKKKHRFCSTCSDQGCVLCLFIQLNETVHDIDEKNRRVTELLKRMLIWSRLFMKSEQNKNEGPFANKPPANGVRKCDDDVKDEDESDVDDACTICTEQLTSSVKILSVCRHRFHQECIQRWFETSGKKSCPTCGHIYGTGKGPQPPGGKMLIKYIKQKLPGFHIDEKECQGNPTIQIDYEIPSGKQGPLNPNPGAPFQGTKRTAYLPNNNEGREVLSLLRRAFDDQHLFTIGRSTTTGAENVVTWNDIHHKTHIDGGPERYGYPDPTYLNRVRQELAAKGYT